MHELTTLLKNDMLPALGVTEPGAIAFCVATARGFADGELKCLHLTLNSGMYKNGFTCGIPHCDEFGNSYAAALGYIAGNADKGLQSLEDVTDEELKAAKALVKSGKITVDLGEITSRIYIQVDLYTFQNTVTVIAENVHTNLTKIIVDERVILDNSPAYVGDKETTVPLIHRYTLKELFDYAMHIPEHEIAFVRQAYEMNLALFNEGLQNRRTVFARTLLAMNGGKIISDREQETAELLCGGAIEARVLGLDLPAMSITGSGAHGIIATLPLYASKRMSWAATA